MKTFNLSYLVIAVLILASCSSEPKENIRKQKTVAEIRNELSGEQAINLYGVDRNNNKLSLYDIKADYTILYFLDAKCRFCEKEMPELKSTYDRLRRQNNSIKMVSFNLGSDKSEWQKYSQKIRPNWINLDLLEERNSILKKYKITSSPLIYVLDQNKKIISGKLHTAESLHRFFRNKI